MKIPGKYVAALAIVSFCILCVGILLLATSMPDDPQRVVGWINVVFGILGVILAIVCW